MRWLIRGLGGLLALLALGAGGVLLYFDRSEDRLVFSGTRLGSEYAVPGRTGLEWDSVRIRSAEGIEVFLVEIAPESRDGPWVLYFHGNGNLVGSPGNVEHYGLFRELGYGVLAMEYRGYGASKGLTPREDGLYADARVAWEYLVARGARPERIVLYGGSLGSGVATWLATHVEAAGLITKGAYTSLPAAARTRYPWLPTGWVMDNRFDNLARAGSIDEPWLILHGRSDQVVPFSHGTALARAAPRGELVPLEGGHDTLLGASPEALRALRTFSEALLPRGRADVVPPAPAEPRSSMSDEAG